MPVISMFYGIIVRMFTLTIKSTNAHTFTLSILDGKQFSLFLMAAFFQVIYHREN